MNKKFYLLFVIIMFNMQAYAKPKIVVSITPLASIVAMLLGDNAEIITIAASSSCPHHFHLSPGNLKAVQDASIYIYIDENFDGFASKLMKNSSANIIKIGDIKTLKINRDNKGPNWHIWLDLSNARAILMELSYIFGRQFPELKQYIGINLEQSLQQIIELSKVKEQKLSQIGNVVLLSDSLEYIFSENSNIIKLYEPEHRSLKFLNIVSKTLLNQSRVKCLVFNKDQDTQFYQKYKLPIIRLESENWAMEKNLKNLYFDKYFQMINQLYKCINN